jgi:hypothetical protein
LPGDEQALLDAFTRLAPQGSLRWIFEDTMRRLSTPTERSTWIEPWDGLPADLWDRGRGARASERMMGDVINVVAQELTEYTQRIVDDARRTAPEEVAVYDALRYLAARVERLESAVDPLGIRPGELDLPVADHTEWAASVPSWAGAGTGDTVVVGELDDRSVVDALVQAGATPDVVDPRAAVVWSQGPVDGWGPVAVGDVVDHLSGLAPSSCAAVVLSGSVDRASLAGKVELVDGALRVLVPGGTLVVLARDQAAWDAEIPAPVRDLLPGRPLHPQTWALVLARRGLADPEVHIADRGTVHAVVARRPR